MKRLVFPLFLLLLLLSMNAYAAYLTNVPQTIVQPNGDTIHCFASGDEFYNWLHDAKGYTIIQNEKTGWYSYAQQKDGKLVPSELIPGKQNPANFGIEPALKQPFGMYNDRIETFNSLIKKKSKKNESPKTLQLSGEMNNLIVFIRFKDDTEFTLLKSTINSMFNDTTANASSMKSYFKEVSYNKLSVNSFIMPTSTYSTVRSYQDNQLRSYYKPYNETTNPNGYKSSGEALMREQTLLYNALENIKQQIPASIDLDVDNDGFVDNICFIIKGEPGSWSSLLWPHMYGLYYYPVEINQATVETYNFQIESELDVGTLCHEMFHSIGSPDLYHYSSNGITPVGPWDVMASAFSTPPHMGAYMKWRYGGWIDDIPEIIFAGKYSLQPITSTKNNCYKIASTGSSNEYYILEYRKKEGLFESNIPSSGLIIYRINLDASDGSVFGGNAYGPPDEVYAYRPGGSLTQNGNIDSAFFSLESQRTIIMDDTDPVPFLSNGAFGGLFVYNIGSAGDSITFTVGFNSIPPTQLSPPDKSIRQEPKVQFRWTTSKNAKKYGIQIARDSLFDSLVYQTRDLTSPSYISGLLKYNSKYFWRVNVTTEDVVTEWSEPWSMKTCISPPNLFYPTNNAARIEPNIELKWKQHPDAINYRLQVSNSPNFNKILREELNLTDSSFTLTGLSSLNKYYWRVAGISEEGQGAWSDTWNFTTILASPTNLSPSIDSCGLPIDGYLTWKADTVMKKFTVQLAEDINFNNIVLDSFCISSTSTSFTGLKNNTQYYWRCKSYSAKDSSSWSPVWTFCTIIGTPNAIYPADSIGGVATQNSLLWSEVEGVVSYSFQLSSDSLFSDLIVNEQNYSTNTYASLSLDNNKTYYWHILAIGEKSQSPWSPTAQFTTMVSAPSLLTPTNNSTNIPNNCNFVWNTTKGANAYELSVAKDSVFSELVLNENNIDVNMYSAPHLASFSKLFWKVRGIKNTYSGEWSEVWNFTTTVSSIAESNKNLILSISPNPVSGTMQCEFNFPYFIDYIEFSIVDIFGKKQMLLYSGAISQGISTMNFNTSELSSGVYVLRLSGRDIAVSQKIIILH